MLALIIGLAIITLGAAVTLTGTILTVRVATYDLLEAIIPLPIALFGIATILGGIHVAF